MPSRLKLKCRSRKASNVGSRTSVRRRQREGLARRRADRLVIGAHPGGERLGLGRGDLAPSQVYERIGQIVGQDIALAGAVDREAAASVMPRCRPAYSA